MNNQDILFASLVGSKVVKSVSKFQLLENEMQKRVLPGLPFNLQQDQSKVARPDYSPLDVSYTADAPADETQHYFPLKMSVDEENWFLLPYEPMMNISGKNQIIKRNVAKWTDENKEEFQGSIKERWARGDYEITITGFLFGSIVSGNFEDCFPRTDFEKLKQLITHSKQVYVLSPPLELLGIYAIAIEDFSFPFTKGENVQAYEIKAVSDFKYNLLIKD